MGANVNSGLTTASITGTITSTPAFVVPSATQTIKIAGSGKSVSTVNSGTGVNLYSVTAGKTFYLTGFIIGNQSDAGQYMWQLTDNGVGGTLKLNGVTPAGSTPLAVSLTTPVAFSTNVYLDMNATKNVNWCLYGFEQ